VQSGTPDIQPWWKEASAEMWWEAGFARRSGNATVRRRFIELEELAVEDFFAASAGLVRLVIDRSGGHVGFDIAVECTEAETNARLHHDCREGDGCPGWAPVVVNRHARRILPKDAGSARPALSTADANAHREQINEQPFPADPDDAREMVGDAGHITHEADGDGARVKVGGHGSPPGAPAHLQRRQQRDDPPAPHRPRPPAAARQRLRPARLAEDLRPHGLPARQHPADPWASSRSRDTDGSPCGVGSPREP